MGSLSILTPLVIVYDFHVMGVVLAPNKADTPLIVDADAVLPDPIAFQNFQSVAGRRPQICHIHCRVQDFEFPQGCPLNVLRQSPGSITLLCVNDVK